jgi:hypothetical protein
MPTRLLDAAERFKLAHPFMVVCQRCGHTGNLAVVSAGVSGLTCTKPDCGGLWRSGMALALASTWCEP